MDEDVILTTVTDDIADQAQADVTVYPLYKYVQAQSSGAPG